MPSCVCAIIYISVVNEVEILKVRQESKGDTNKKNKIGFKKYRMAACFEICIKLYVCAMYTLRICVVFQLFVYTFYTSWIYL